MSRIAIPDLDDTPVASRPMLDEVHQRLGFVPNVHRLMAVSPATLAGFTALQTEMGKVLDIKTRDAIALAVSEADGCDYCLAAHSYIAANFARLSPDEIALNRQGKSQDSRRAAAVHFCRILVETRGKVSDGNLAYVRRCGFSDSEIVEMIALAVQYLLTNFLNNVAKTDIDFPGIEAAHRAS